MKIEYWLECSKEIEIDLSAEDISVLYREAYSEDPKAVQQAILSTLNGIAGYFRGIPDEVISELSDGQKETISAFLIEQGGRFKP